MTDVRLNIARDLREIQALYADLRAEAISHADDADIPAGDPGTHHWKAAGREPWVCQRCGSSEQREITAPEMYGCEETDARHHPETLQDEHRAACEPADLDTVKSIEDYTLDERGGA